MSTKVITLSTTDWTKIEYSDTRSWAWFSFWSDNSIQFAEIPAPAWDQRVPLAADTRVIFKKPIIFYVKWSIWDNIFLAPFEK